jgi:lysozyme
MRWGSAAGWDSTCGDAVNVDRDRLQQQLILHEGLRLFPYSDTVGKTTIGVGRNLTDNGISHVEALFLLDNDIELRVFADLERHAPWVAQLDPVRQAVVIDMCFNLGWPRLSLFRNTLAAMKRGDWVSAAEGMRASKWAKQVGNRAVRLRQMMLTGQFPNEANT